MNNFVMDPEEINFRWIDAKAKEPILAKFTEICTKATELFVKDPVLLHLASPTIIYGDIHGSFKDLKYFGNKFSIDFAPTKHLFLGDFVDRGQDSVEVVLYLFIQKIMYPDKIFLVKGNHEYDEVNGGEFQTSFYNSCVAFAGNVEIGKQFFQSCNNAFGISSSCCNC
jgi:hypothetical protein